MSTTPSLPGIRGQQEIRTAFLVLGVVLLVTAVGLLAVGLADFFGSMSSFDGPHRFWMVMVGILMLDPAGWCLQAGFMGAAARNDADASLCDSCGAALAH